MLESGAGAAMVFDFDYARADAGSLDHSVQVQDEREHPTHFAPLALLACLLSFAAGVTVFAAFLLACVLLKLPTASKRLASRSESFQYFLVLLVLSPRLSRCFLSSFGLVPFFG